MMLQPTHLDAVEPIVQPVSTQNELPPEIFLAILTLLDRIGLLNSRVVNRSWYQFISNFDQVLLVPSMQEYIQSKMARISPHQQPALAAFSPQQLQAVALRINQQVKPTQQMLHRTQIALAQQFTPESISAILMRTARDNLRFYQYKYGALVQGTHIYRNIILVSLAYTFFVATLVYALKKRKGIDTTYLDEVREAPLDIANRLAVRLGRRAAIVFSVSFMIMFFVALYRNYQESRAVYEQNLHNDVVHAAATPAVTANVAMPERLRTIAWEHTLFAPPSASLISSTSLAPAAREQTEPMTVIQSQVLERPVDTGSRAEAVHNVATLTQEAARLLQRP